MVNVSILEGHISTYISRHINIQRIVKALTYILWIKISHVIFVLQLWTIWLIKDRMKSRRALFTIVYFCQWRGLTKNWPSWSWEFLHAILIYICFEERLVTHYHTATNLLLHNESFVDFQSCLKFQYCKKASKFEKNRPLFKKNAEDLQNKVGDFFKSEL